MILTKNGKIILSIILALMFAGLNTRSNLMHLFNTFLICVWLLSPLFAQKNLFGLKTKVYCPSEIYTEEQATIQVLFANETDENKYAVHFEDPTCHQKLFIPHIPAQSQIMSTYSTIYSQRGVVQWQKVFLATVHPFGLFKNQVSSPTNNKLYVLPKVKPLENFPFHYFDRNYSNKQKILTNEKISRDSFSRLREYTQGDNPRYIDWKASARKNDLVVREYVDENPVQCDIIIAFQIRSQYVDQQHQEFEDTISTTAAICAEICEKGRISTFAIQNKIIHDKSLKLRQILRCLTELKIQSIEFIAPKKSSNHLVIVSNTVTPAIKKYVENVPSTTLIIAETTHAKYVDQQYTFSVKPKTVRLEKYVNQKASN